jgi:LacI family transcriptional regulator
MLAVEIYNYLQQKKNLNVPNDVSLVGYDDLPFTRFMSVPLTTIRQNLDRESELAAEILFDKIENKTSAIKQIMMPVELVTRQSTTKVKI